MGAAGGKRFRNDVILLEKENDRKSVSDVHDIQHYSSEDNTIHNYSNNPHIDKENKFEDNITSPIMHVDEGMEQNTEEDLHLDDVEESPKTIDRPASVGMKKNIPLSESFDEPTSKQRESESSPKNYLNEFHFDSEDKNSYSYRSKSRGKIKFEVEVHPTDEWANSMVVHDSGSIPQGTVEYNHEQGPLGQSTNSNTSTVDRGSSYEFTNTRDMSSPTIHPESSSNVDDISPAVISYKRDNGSRPSSKSRASILPESHVYNMSKEVEEVHLAPSYSSKTIKGISNNIQYILLIINYIVIYYC
jgi:hypothetical protein